MGQGLNSMEWRSVCGVSCALDLVGDKWTLLILRDLLIKQQCTFSQFLSAPEQISTNILTARLTKLLDLGLVTKGRGPSKRSHLYGLTAAGRDLEPVIRALAEWSGKHLRAHQPGLVTGPGIDHISRV
jgi:DNA-binding HxlR family transcriptional regulator